MNRRCLAVRPVTQTEVAPHFAVRLDLEKTVGADPPQTTVADQHVAERSRFAEDFVAGCFRREPKVDQHDAEHDDRGRS